ncbi:YqzE family protein [Heyndrickxia coagulans]
MQHVSTPKSERQKKRNEKKEEMPPFAERWFGILPYFFLFFKRKQ